MRNPKEVFGEKGYLDYLVKVKLLEDSVNFFINMADDLHIGNASDFRNTQEVEDQDELLKCLYTLGSFFNARNILIDGPWESDED